MIRRLFFIAAFSFLSSQLSWAGDSWRYSADTDQLTLKTTYLAALESINTVSFGFPYSGEQHGRLTLRTHPQYGKDVILSIDKGQFLCGIEDCTIHVRFDKNPPIAFTAVEPADHSTTTLFIRNYAKFVALLTKSHEVVIQAAFFQQGNQVFQFDVSGFDPKKYHPK